MDVKRKIRKRRDSDNVVVEKKIENKTDGKKRRTMKCWVW